MFGNLITADSANVQEMLDNNEKVQANNQQNDWVELIKTPSAHFSHATSSMTIEREMEHLEGYKEGTACCC